ncbi:hypothetical protein ABZY44_23825 [Streptomyces sp. NPDC006544]|uniref:hypothetical protein n=1 Tax=Streptomyces sp. NPDC006544 TaxID=3154583 RepID=UPI0033BDF553
MALVDMLVANEVLPELQAMLPALRARERAHRPALDYSGGTVVTLEIEGAPEGAVRIEPVFQRTGDRVSVQQMNWQYSA